MKTNTPIVKLRKAVRHGRTLYISLPKAFVELHGIEPGEKLPIICNHILKVIPCKEQ